MLWRSRRRVRVEPAGHLEWTIYARVYAAPAVYSLTEFTPGDVVFTEGSDPGPSGNQVAEGMYESILGNNLSNEDAETAVSQDATPPR